MSYLAMALHLVSRMGSYRGSSRRPNHTTPLALPVGVPVQEVEVEHTQRLARGSSAEVYAPRSGREPTPEELANTEPVPRIDLELDDPPVRRSRLPILVLALALMIALATFAAAMR